MSLARLFQRPHYRSEATQFISDLKNAKPDLDRKQREGRSLLWDKRIDRELQAEFRAGGVAQPGYVYYEWDLAPHESASTPEASPNPTQTPA